MKKIALVALVAACGDNNPSSAVDAHVHNEVDATTAPDAPPTLPFGGTVSLIESQVLNSNGSAFGQGLLAGATFTPASTPAFEEIEGSPLGCKVWEIPAAAYEGSRLGLDEGPVTYTIGGEGAAIIPTCAYVTGAGYICPDNATAGAGGIVAAGPAPGTATLTDMNAVFSDANSLGRYVQIAGATNPSNNGAFPIVGLVPPTTLVYANPVAVAETLPNTATHISLAGVGPIPSEPDPGFLADDASISIALSSGGGAHFADFTATASDVGNDFTLSETELAKLFSIPTDGAEFTLSCDSTNCPTGSAQGSVLLMQTTDGSTSGASPYALPAPSGKSVLVRCGGLATSLTVPAAAMAFIQNAGATRIRTSFNRVNLLGGVPPTVSGVAGHGLIGFTYLDI